MPSPDVDDLRLEHLVDELGDRADVVALVSRYLTELDVRQDLLAKAHRMSDLDMLRRVGHTMRSTSQMLGADALVEVCRSLETASEGTDLDGLLREFADAADAARAGLVRWQSGG